jgi:hypothetical protein
MPKTVPNGPSDGATFDLSNTTHLSLPTASRLTTLFLTHGRVTFHHRQRQLQFTVSAIQAPLTAGTVMTLISNTSAEPISGAFSNLPHGAAITLGHNTFRASYEGGDGNALTLTVIC